MWMGHGLDNQWPAAMFHNAIDQAMAEDRESVPLSLMTDDDMRAAYLMVFLGIVPPAGRA